MKQRRNRARVLDLIGRKAPYWRRDLRYTANQCHMAHRPYNKRMRRLVERLHRTPRPFYPVGHHPQGELVRNGSFTASPDRWTIYPYQRRILEAIQRGDTILWGGRLAGRATLMRIATGAGKP